MTEAESASAHTHSDAGHHLLTGSDSIHRCTVAWLPFGVERRRVLDDEPFGARESSP
ncbi:MAG: hypothetical protein M5T61_17265 [Acidimicrobiia bacterium]|nr:hypothetical protein [Acidimicrobiia bacterium]